MKNHEKIKMVSFFDGVQTAEEYLKRKDLADIRRDPAGELLIAMDPSVGSYLRQNGLPSQNTLPYLTDDLRREMLEKSFALTNWLREECGFSNPAIGIKDAHKESFIFFSRFIINYLLTTIGIALKTIEAHRPAAVSAALSGKRRVESLFIEPEERYLGYIIKRIADKKSLRFEDTSDGRDGYGDLSAGNTYFPTRSMIKFFPAYAKFRIWSRKVARSRHGAPDKLVFFDTRLYQMDKVFEQFRKRFPVTRTELLNGPAISSFDIPDPVIKMLWADHSAAIIAQKRSAGSLVKKISEETGLFSYKDIFFGDLAAKKIRDNIAGYMLGQSLWAVKMDRFLDAARPSVILSAGNRPDGMVLAELCRKKGIASVLISHGSFVPPKNNYEAIEWGEHGRVFLRAPFDYVALQTPMAEGYLDAFPSPNSPVKTGPLIWGKPVDEANSKSLFDKMFGGRYEFKKIKIILHAGSTKPQNISRFHIYESLDEYIQSIVDLATVVNKIPGAFLIIKFRPTCGISVDSMKTLVPFSDKVILSIDEPLRDTLGMSDLLVSFSSTTIEEALQNRVPVLLYGGGGRYQHISAPVVRPEKVVCPSAVYHVKDAGHLQYAIENIFRIYEDRDRNDLLFEPYIYPGGSRTGLGDMLKEKGRID